MFMKAKATGYFGAGIAGSCVCPVWMLGIKLGPATRAEALLTETSLQPLVFFFDVYLFRD